MEINYDKENNLFAVRYAQQSFFLKSELNLIDEFDLSDFEFYFLYNHRNDATENSIYKVYIDDERVGWIFPIQSLVSVEHRYAEDEYYLRYAYISYYKLAELCVQKKVGIMSDWYSDDEKNGITISDNNDNYSEEIYLSDIVTTDFTSTNLLVIDKRNVEKIENYTFDRYRIGFIVHGYGFYDEESWPFNNSYYNIDTNIHIKGISTKLAVNAPLMNIVNKMILMASDEYSLFLTLYQVIEILIDKQLIEKFQQMLFEYKNNDNNDIQSFIEDLKEISPERTRIRNVFNNHCRIKTDNRTDLSRICYEISSNHNGKDRTELPDLLYDVRCHLVHRFYSFNDDEYENKLQILNDAFVRVTYDMLTSYN